MKTLLFIFTALILSSSMLRAGHNFINPNNDNFYCKVVAVLDGDTIDCLNSRKKIRVRLASIDAPEKSQPFGRAAKKQLHNYIFNKNIIVSVESKDKYNRYIAELFLNKRSPYSINYLMIKKGLAWSYDRFVKDRAYISASRKAKHSKKGLWIKKNPLNPEKYRHSKLWQNFKQKKNIKKRHKFKSKSDGFRKK